jgi:putative redox protein
MSRNVSVNSGSLRFVQNISVDPHVFQADEPSENGGKDAGPDPHELLLAALGACAGITVQMYADRKQWPLEGVQFVLSYAKFPAEDRADSDTKIGMVAGVEMGISFAGDLSEDQQLRLLEIAVLNSDNVSAGFNGATRAPDDTTARRPTTNSTQLSETSAIVPPRLSPSPDSCAMAEWTRESSSP